MIKFVVLCALVAARMGCPDEVSCRKCVKEAEQSKCEVCHMGWTDLGGKCMIKAVKERIDHCLVYELPRQGEPTKCLHCEFGFFQTGGKCVQCKVEGCAVCPNAEDCHACFNGQKLNMADKKCVKDPSAVPNCAICNYFRGKDTCLCELCNDKFVLDPSKESGRQCVDDKVGNCQILDTNDLNRCVLCLPGYYITGDGKCANDGRKATSWALFIALGALIIAIPVIWFVVKKRRERSHDHYHTVPVPANPNLPYTQRLVN